MDDEKTLETLQKQLVYWKTKHDAMIAGGIYSSAKAIRRLKRKDDLNKAYVLAAEELLKTLDLDAQKSELEVTVRLAMTSLNEARKDLGLVRREHTAEQCGGKCKYHRGEV